MAIAACFSLLAAVEELAHALRDHPAVIRAGCLQVPDALMDDEAASIAAAKALKEAESSVRARRKQA